MILRHKLLVKKEKGRKKEKVRHKTARESAQLHKMEREESVIETQASP